jgi:hypothetical protein
VKIIYAPDGAERREFPITPNRLRSPDAEAIEEVGGTRWENFDEWAAQFKRGGKRAERAGLWICLRRDQPDLQFHDVDFAANELAVVWDDDEKRAMRAATRADPDLSDDVKESILEAIGMPAGGEDLTPLEPSGSPAERTDSVPDGTNTAGP